MPQLSSGPPYPPAPVAGSNAIGKFQIGVSVIGDIPPFVYWSTIISQYANSPIITGLIGDMDAYIDPTANIDSFFDNVFNINTAVGYGLDLWGRILNVGRTVQLSSVSYFGFQEASPGSQTFGQGAFYTGGTTSTNFALTDSSYRTLLFAKALSNICNGSIAGINALLRALFPGRGNAYVIDNGNMQMTYYFSFTLTAVELAIVQQTGVLPSPTGVQVSVQQAN
jgi:hypothetical protein